MIKQTIIGLFCMLMLLSIALAATVEVTPSTGNLLVEGKIGLGTIAPDAKLHIQDGGLLVTGTSGITPVSGSGVRMMWVPNKAAFRAGTVTGAQWNDVHVGEHSFAAGRDTFANGTGSFSQGFASSGVLRSSGTASFAQGRTFSGNLISSGSGSFAQGHSEGFFGSTGSISSTGVGSFAQGRVFAVNHVGEIVSSGTASFAQGLGFSGRIRATGSGSFAQGMATEGTIRASGSGSLARGFAHTGDIVASGVGSMAAGLSDSLLSAEGNASFAFGENVKATANNAFSLGKDFENSVADTFAVGFNQKDFEVRSGQARVFGTMTADTVQQSSDARLKTNVYSAASTHAAIMALTPVDYTLVSDETQHLGLIAQEVKNVLPIAVKEDVDGYLALDQGALIAALVSTVQEQQKQIQALQKDLAELRE